MASFDAEHIAGLYESVIGETGVDAALASVHERMGCVAGVILSFDPLAPHATLSVGSGAMDDGARQLYASEFAPLDPAPPAFARLSSGSITSTDRLFPLELRNHSIVLQEFLRPLGIDETAAGVISPGGGRFAMLAMLRGPDRAAFDDDDFAAVKQLLPHFAMGLKLHRAFARMETQAAAMTEAIDRLSAGVAILAPDGAVHVNRAAGTVGRRGDGLWFDRKGVPHAINRAAELTLQQLISDARAGGTGGVVRLPRQAAPASYVVLVAPLPVATGLEAAKGTVIVMVHDPAAMSDMAPDAIAAAFDLPLQAAEMLAALLQGEEASAYAKRRGLSYETVRYHLKTAFARTGARSRARLLQAVAVALRDLGGGPLTGRRREPDVPVPALVLLRAGSRRP